MSEAGIYGLVTVLDLFSRKIISWKTGSRLHYPKKNKQFFVKFNS